MGEISEMMLDGTLCEGCGDFLGDGDGIPQYCASCAPSQDDGITRTKDGQQRPSKINCPNCGKLVKKTGLEDHQRDVHGGQI